ncbi:cupin-like domain-containing protein [Pyxidicoccus caerfyrddinensis]|uniref:cupin-like domain-containing protein n=1 Tax=Pyxidicoccus caerfyrddinensis TaxID=2709663 RepID=UPI0013DD5F20|nr:cupin-like domain-containing protein [Pyxidicoccus caerfyrddinensis]
MNVPPLPFEAQPVPRVHRPRPEALLARALDAPVVVEGCLEDWPLLRELRAAATPEAKVAALGARFGARPVTFHQMHPRSGGHYHFREDLQDVTFGAPREGAPFDAFGHELLRSLRGESGDYVYMQAHLIERGTPLFDGLGPGVLPFLTEEQLRPLMWAGSNGQVVNLHYDDFLNFICMVEGTKRVTMFAPELMASLYHAPFDRMLEEAQASHVRMLSPDLERFPRFREAQREARVAVIGPGDVLVIPPMWWHHVESFGLNVMVNNWVLAASFEQLGEVQRNLTEAIRLFFPRTHAERARALALYRRTVFVDAPEAFAPEPDEPAADARHRARTRALVAGLPAFLRRQVALYYEHFTFQASGDPIPTPPGAFAAMVERNAGAPTFFAREPME